MRDYKNYPLQIISIMAVVLYCSPSLSNQIIDISSIYLAPTAALDDSDTALARDKRNELNADQFEKELIRIFNLQELVHKERVDVNGRSYFLQQ